MDDNARRFIQEHLGYNDEELEIFLNNKKNVEILSKAPALMMKTIVAEVVASHGCNSRHQVGDKFYFDGAGNFLTKLNPKRVCIHALSALSGPIYVANELFYADVDPNEMRLNRVGCFDVGVRCGGWGHIAMEIQVVERE
jgi:uncharacterized repeat protein (TIGR04076 family)